MGTKPTENVCSVMQITMFITKDYVKYLIQCKNVRPNLAGLKKIVHQKYLPIITRPSVPFVTLSHRNLNAYNSYSLCPLCSFFPPKSVLPSS